MIEGLPDGPAPVLYAMNREGDRLFLVMEYVQGQQLDQVWSDLSEAQKLSITSQLRRATDNMRGLLSPGYFGGMVGGPVPHRFFFSAKKDSRSQGHSPQKKSSTMSSSKNQRRTGNAIVAGPGWLNSSAGTFVQRSGVKVAASIYLSRNFLAARKMTAQSQTTCIK
ncbi:uncharacterized protein F5Z01DRAFT_657856 [Emericellopsis atlantica]|uniref:Aminoglycoside phosphotransferase domain-containing protein n=1 Tax=Emericellopsis atlantica TaxID=2614577 RepID=A0A9P8CP15_9HYPO|nr:uncharacterized protein F5Z01DRAFT_657856 [Emericellopsis atlantica]KAG9253650.1 hypothetical protein F5Z01DRAFT_657856 [Emericellopsis atlantica]